MSEKRVVLRDNEDDRIFFLPEEAVHKLVAGLRESGY